MPLGITQTGAIGIIGAAIFLALLGGHFFPWRKFARLVDDRGHLKPVLCYVYGVGWIGLGFTAWTLLHADRLTTLEAIAVFWIVAAAAGAGTLAGYGVDAFRMKDEG